MQRTFASLSLVALLTGPIFGQSAAAPAFDIADVHASPRRTNPNMAGGAIKAGRYELRNATMVDLIRTAYGIEAEKVVGGPNWLELDRFDLIARVPASTTVDNAKLMLRTLLADRFKLVTHEDTRPLQAYALTAGPDKPKLTESKEGGSPGPGCQGQPQTPQAGVTPQNTVMCRNMSMAALAEQLPRMAGVYINNPIVDQTGLKGSYDFQLTWTARALLTQAGNDGITIFDAVDKQLGLKLELKPIPSSTLVVDSVNQQPTANAAAVAASLPTPPPPEFEVADIKPSAPGAPGPIGRIQPTGQVNASGLPLKMLITLAWDINSDDLIDGPKWLETAKFDLVAKAFSGVAEGQGFDIDDLRRMLQALLVDRFKMKTHFEDRQVSGYALLANNPKLTKADPASRTRCAEGPPAGVRDPRNANPVLARLVSCQNITMAQFADRLLNIGGGYIRTPVADATGLEGTWNLMLNFSPPGLVLGRGAAAGPAAATGGATAATDPNGALSIGDALNRQLGLKLEMQKRPMQVLVIDSIQEKPTDN